MSDDPALSVASARPRRAENAQPAGLAEDLLDLAAAIKWVEGRVMASKASARDGLAAIERIQDIGFALRECAVDAALCDALEAATREVAGIIAENEAAAERAQSASKLLGVLADRIAAMIENVAQPAGERASAAPADAPGDTGRDSKPSDGDAARPSAMPQFVANDPLVLLRTLSAEELIALFS